MALDCFHPSKVSVTLLSEAAEGSCCQLTLTYVKFPTFVDMTLGVGFTRAWCVLHWNSLPFGFWGSSPKVPQHSLSSPAVFSLTGLSLNFQKDFANLLQLNIPLSYSAGYLAFKSHGLRESSFQASFLCGSKRGSL